MVQGLCVCVCAVCISDGDGRRKCSFLGKLFHFHESDDKFGQPKTIIIIIRNKVMNNNACQDTYPVFNTEIFQIFQFSR